MRILITESLHFSEAAIAQLRSAGHTVDCKQLTREQLLPIINQYDGLIVRLGISLDRQLLERSALSFIATPTTGLNHIDLAVCKQKKIAVYSLKGETQFLKSITPTAELTMGLLFSLLRHLPAAFDSVKRGEWDRDRFVGTELKGKVLGVVGLGRLGVMVARYGKAFGMQVCYYDPHVSTTLYKKYKTLAALFAVADVISLHVPLEPKTKNMIGSALFNRCKPTALFLNTARGELVDEAALLKALQTGTIAGAGLDVLTNEVGKKTLSNPLIAYARTHDNIIITPHIGGAAWDSMRKTEEFVVEKILAAARTKKLR